MLIRLKDATPKTLLLGGAALFSVFPLLSMLSAALQPQGSSPAGFSIPTDPQWHNFVDAWNVANITTLMKSSIILVIGVVPVAILIAAMAAYAIAQLRIPFGNVFFLLLLLGLTLPYEIVVVPLYYQMQGLGLLNTKLATSSRSSASTCPSLCSGCGRTSCPCRPSCPSRHRSTAPGHGRRSGTFSFLLLSRRSRRSRSSCSSTWNQFLLAIVLVDDPNQRTMAGALQGFVWVHSTDVVLLNAGALLIMAPTILVFLVFQRYFIQAMLAGAVKG